MTIGGGGAGDDRKALPPSWLLGSQAVLGAWQSCGLERGAGTVSEEPPAEPGSPRGLEDGKC